MGNEQKTVFITGADRGIGLALCREFLQHGWHVIGGRYMTSWTELDSLKQEYDSFQTVDLDVSNTESVKKAAEKVKTLAPHIDMLVHVAGIIKRDDSKGPVAMMLAVNTVGPIRVVKEFLPLMQEGDKRLCFFSSEAGSISLAHRKNEYGYGVSKASLNMGVKLMFNDLRKDGFTFRLYHPGWVNSFMETEKKSTIAPYEPEDTVKTAYRAFTTDRSCEDVLVMTDINDQTWSF
ncbi:MAG: SDR family NAD(P)-dependent oxidoreductase [Lachnospiraceae bacterium]|nr:SDR family NAD(P)-dependent oxidoreductase [Lachnospiraceae bacterium]